MSRALAAGVALLVLLLMAAVVLGLSVASLMGGADDVTDPGPAASRGGSGSSGSAGRAPSGIPADAEPAILDRVVDGDTLRVVAEPGGSMTDGGSVRVRLLNIDAPELARDGAPAECGAAKARDRLEELVTSGDLVWLAADEQDRDRFDRPLRGVWTGDGAFVNQVLAEEGLAVTLLIPPNDRFHLRIEEAVTRAQAAEHGIWGALCRGQEPSAAVTW